jgi:riboflavin transporter FmnP
MHALGGHRIDMSEPSPLVRKVKVSLDETRILIIGAQILLGIQFVGTFQEGFASLTFELRALHVVALVALVACMGCLIAPSMQHRIVEKGYESMRILRTAGTMAGIALVLFAIAIAIDNFNIQSRIFGTTVALVATGAFLIFLTFLWFVPFWHDRVERRHIMHSDACEKNTPLADRIEQMLTEARVVLPGAQALLGFQFAVTLTRAFEALPIHEKIMHVGALSVVALAVILLMTPAAIHRVAMGGQNTEGFLRTGSRLIVAATLPLALGIAIDIYVAVSTAIGEIWGVALACGVFTLLAVLWYALPFGILYRQRAKERTAEWQTRKVA